MNFNQYTYKQKIRYLLILAFLFALAAYVMTLRKTVQLYQQNVRLEAKIRQAENAPQEIAQLKQDLETLNSKLDHYLIDTTKEQEHTLEVVSEFCHRKKLTLKELPKRKVEEGKDFTILTSVLKIEGTYPRLLQLLHELEYSQRLGRLSSVSWKSSEDHKTKRTILYMTVYLQNIAVNKKNQKDNEKTF